MPMIKPFLWYDGQAEEAARFYVSVFPNSRVGTISRYNAAGPGPEGSVMTVEFELDGKPFVALNGGPTFKFNEAVSFYVDCDTQEDVDRYWNALTRDGGQEIECGWLKDRWGLCWQIGPRRLLELLADPDRAKAERVMKAMLKMKKIVVADLEKAAAGTS
jgi:predicted 3-demethylubiquinone-9 3-methyltransferase (glyoxalase superfamily)